MSFIKLVLGQQKQSLMDPIYFKFSLEHEFLVIFHKITVVFWPTCQSLTASLVKASSKVTSVVAIAMPNDRSCLTGPIKVHEWKA